MKIAFAPPAVPRFARIPQRLPYLAVILVLLALLAFQLARLVWVVVTPVGMIGDWTSESTGSTADETLLARFDPFFRDGLSTGGPAIVTNLALKLFGVRLNEASGQGSAIIATPDGVQSSYGVGDEIVPGVKLKAVSFDGVTIDRGGTAEQIYLDQSIAAPVVQPAATSAAPATPLANDIAFSARLEKGQVTGIVVAPKGTGAAFAAAGLKAGDVLTRINGQAVKSAEDATRAISAKPPSGIVMLVVERDGKAMTLSAKVTP